MLVDTITQTYQPPKIEYKPLDEDAIEPDLNSDFEGNATH